MNNKTNALGLKKNTLPKLIISVVIFIALMLVVEFAHEMSHLIVAMYFGCNEYYIDFRIFGATTHMIFTNMPSTQVLYLIGIAGGSSSAFVCILIAMKFPDFVNKKVMLFVAFLWIIYAIIEGMWFITNLTVAIEIMGIVYGIIIFPMTMLAIVWEWGFNK